MARKGNQHKNGLDRHSSSHKKKVSDLGSAVPDNKGRGKVGEVKIVAGEELPNGNPSSVVTESVSEPSCIGDEPKRKQRSGKFLKKEKQGPDAMQNPEQSVPCESSSGDCIGSCSTVEASGIREENGTSPSSNHGLKYQKCGLGYLPTGFDTDNVMENLGFSDLISRNLRDSAFSMQKVACEWLEKQKPLFITLAASILGARDYVREKIEQTYPIVLRWLMHLGNIFLLLSIVWLDCTFRGIDSFLRMGTTSFFSVVWCSIFSLIAMTGMTKFLVVLAIAGLMGVFIGFTLAIITIAISGIVLLWLYGSFWTTSLIIFFGGLAFTFSHERLALFITTVYSVYCAWTYVGWFGLLLGLNLSFISSDALVYYLKSTRSEHSMPNSPPEQTDGTQGRRGFFYGDPLNASSPETRSGGSADRGQGVPSTSGDDSEITSEEEIIRLLNCTDHYSALGLSCFGNVDVSLLKREYRKKAMLVHPDKNMGNEKAAEAFKKLQNAYEVLLDCSKRQAYDDELRREELLNYFRKFQGTSQKNGRHGFFPSGFTMPEADGEDPFGESRRISCKKCGNFHVWVHTKKLKSRARYCQDCKDFHPAKDGDGWVEQSSQPFFFGILQRVDHPTAYVCAESRIYDATEWYICQGMRCPVNTHKASFHVNTSVTSRHTSGKGTSSAQKGGIPTPNMEETMTEEEFFEWLQNAVHAGVFDPDSPSATRSGNFSKSGSGGNNSGGGASGSGGNKRKKKGKKQW